MKKVVPSSPAKKAITSSNKHQFFFQAPEEINNGTSQSNHLQVDFIHPVESTNFFSQVSCMRDSLLANEWLNNDIEPQALTFEGLKHPVYKKQDIKSVFSSHRILMKHVYDTLPKFETLSKLNVSKLKEIKKKFIIDNGSLSSHEKRQYSIALYKLKKTCGMIHIKNSKNERYSCRKKFAQKRARIGGRFTCALRIDV